MTLSVVAKIYGRERGFECVFVTGEFKRFDMEVPEFFGERFTLESESAPIRSPVVQKTDRLKPSRQKIPSCSDVS